MKRSLFLLLCLAAGWISCHNKPVTVVVDRVAGDSLPGRFLLTIDKDSSYRIPGDTTFEISLSPGSHTLSVDQHPPVSFRVPEAGGILNLSNIDYVAFEVRYETRNKRKYYMDVDEARVRFPVILDSILVLPQRGGMVVFNDSDMAAMLHFMRSEGVKQTLRDEVISGLLKTGKNQLLVKKIWDYHMTERMPVSLKEEQHSNGEFSGANATYKTTVLRAEQFLLRAMLDTVNYRIKIIPVNLR